MADITSESIKTLREMTGAGMMDCKKALTEANGNMDEAVDWLRKKGLANAAKKAGRVAAEGLVAVATKGNQGAMIELNSETDFVARNDKFQALAKEIVQAVLNSDDAATAKMPSGNSIVDEVTKNVGIIGENMVFRRAKKLSVSKGIVASYVHSAASPGLGKIGILVGLESDAPADKLEVLGKQIAMHIAAAKPEALTTADVDPGALTRERAVLKEQAMASGKSAEIAEKMVEGRIRKYYEEVVLLEQIFVVDGKTKVSEVVAAAGKDAGSPIKLTGFARFTLGEGIEKEATDFAAEVAKAAGAA